MSKIQWLLFASTEDLAQYDFIVKVLAGSAEELCEKSLAWGYDGFELLPDPLNIPEAHQFRRVMHATGALVPVVNTGRFFCQQMPLLVTDRTARRRSIDAFKGVLEFAGGIGARVGLGGARGKCADVAERELAADCFSELAEHAVRCHTVIMLEAVEPEVTSFINTMAEAMQWVAQINSPGFATMLDTHQLANAEPSIEHGIHTANGSAKHIHFYDPSRWPPGVVPSGRGLDWPRVMRVLKETNFQGTGSVVLAPDGDVEAAARISVEFLRRTFASVGATQNEPGSPQKNIVTGNAKLILNA